MISSEAEYEKAREELEHLNRWLSSLENKEVTDRKTLTTASVRRMISRIQEEIAAYEAASVSILPASENSGEPRNTGSERDDRRPK